MKVYLVVESWDNCEEYEDYVHDETVIKVASTREIAEQLLSERKKELIDIAKKENEKRQEDRRVTFRLFDDGSIVFDNSWGLFRACGYSYDSFDWGIKEMDVVME